MKLLLILLLLISCSRPGEPEKPQVQEEEPYQQLMDKFAVLYPLHLATKDSNGFVDVYDCDSLLFSGLLGAVDSEPVNITAARDATGKWHRRPLNYDECYPASSKSTISRDMFHGLLWYAWRKKRLDLANDLYAYGAANNWVMGEGDLSRTYFTPGMQANLAELIFRLGGKNRAIDRNLSQIYSQDLLGFEAHLLALGALLRAEMIGRIEPDAWLAVSAQFKRQPNNALFSFIDHKYGDGNQDHTIQLLLNSKHWPADRLATSYDRKTHWLPQRDEGKDWEPDTEGAFVKFDDGDFVFIARLLGL